MGRTGTKGVLVCAADMRLGKPGGLLEIAFGDVGVSFLLGDSGLLAEFMGHYSLIYEFKGHRRLPGVWFVNAVEALQKGVRFTAILWSRRSRGFSKSRRYRPRISPR